MKNIKTFLVAITLGFTVLIFAECNKGADPNAENAVKIIFLHHSTGMTVWKGDAATSGKLKNLFSETNAVPKWFDEYNLSNNTNYIISERSFPKGKPYGWNNYPYDYYNIWVKHGGGEAYMEEETLEILTENYDLIIFKHCFPVSNIVDGDSIGDINSDEKTMANYKLQYAALKEKIYQFPDTKFIVWTGAAQVESQNSIENARRAREFFNWVKDEWDGTNDNIYLWDFFELETEGGLFLIPEYAASVDDSHPNAAFANSVAPLFCERIVDVIKK